MKKLFTTLILMLFVTSVVFSQNNSFLVFEGKTYYFDELPVTTYKEPGIYTTPAVDENGDATVVDDDDVIWFVEKE
jgi:hypothetical protein